MKKLFTLVALLTCFLGAKAEEVVDYEMDYTTATSWAHGWLNEEEHLVFEQGVGLHFQSTEAQEQFYSFQYQLHPGISGLDNDASYTITLRIKGTVAQDIHASFSGSDTPGMIPITTDWVDVVMEGCVNAPDAPYFANSGSLLIQPGDYVGEFWITYIKITHDEKPSTRPVVWLENITNGDASADWPAWSLETTEEGINTNWRGDRTGEICAWALTMGRNNDNLDGQDGRARPFPADIEEVDGNRAFVVKATQCEIINVGDNPDANSYQWANQFWIQSPKGWKAGTDIKVHFRYKASKAVTAATQIHKQHPSDYLIWHAIGDIAFSEEWKEYDGTMNIADDMADGWSIAFNLNANTPVDGYEPITFYFDDLSWQNMQLDEGWFVAAANATSGIAYDYDNAIEFEGPDEEGVYVATVGTVGKSDTWVNELMISTVRGNDKAFKGATIKPTGKITTDDPDNWQQYTAGSQYKIALPAAGVWQISIAPEDTEINFLMIEGEEPVILEPIDIVTNTTEVIVKGQEREPTASEQPADEEAGTAAGTGQPWDNQFFIVANREFKTGEKVTLKFQYKADKAAKTTTQLHGAPGAYVYWNAIGDVNFTEEWQDFEKTWEIAAGDGGAEITCKSIAFNMAEIKEACNYELKNFQWYLNDDTLEEGKTYENLISAEGTVNFYVKEGAGTSPYQYGTDPSGITNVTAKKNSSAAIYNIAGQKVDKNFKGIVVKDGKKFVNK
jgi:hypothetical protein